MAIQYVENKRIFSLTTNKSSYQMQADTHGVLLHLYYGAKLNGTAEYMITYTDHGFSGNPYDLGKDRTYSLDALPQEYPSLGTGDFRTPALRVRGEHGVYGTDLRFVSHEIKRGKYAIPGFPAVYAQEDEADTLLITLRDEALQLEVELLYGVLEKEDVITRSVKLTNKGTQSIFIEKVCAVCLDYLWGNYELIHFHGRHAMERNIERVPVMSGIQKLGSTRGTSSHQSNPFIILAEQGTGEDYGNCYGISFVYSGGFQAETQKDQFNRTRVVMGLQEEGLAYPLAPSQDFFTPEAILSYSGEGMTTLSHNFQRTLKSHLIRGAYKSGERPVLLNSWEAAYFDFDGEKIYRAAKEAAELGVEMFVLDDGWFGKRNDDYSGLGDWFVNEKKLGCSLKDLIERINALGMKFGIWAEPEMVSEDSDLYRTHPDWAFTIPGRCPIRGRSQLVLDFSRKEVRDYIYDRMEEVLGSANIEYLKWDMNRSITDVYSACDQMQNQGTILYRYMLGLYEFMERLTARFPNLLIEGCSGGGGRFDAGMLYYTPQIWCSDNTDAIDRIRIQYGTSFGYPISAVGSHVSAVPNHQTGRSVPMDTRGITAMAGSFGYELNPSALTEEEKDCVRKQIQQYKSLQSLIYDGLYYRLTNPFEEELAAWEYVSEDRQEALVHIVRLQTHGNAFTQYIKIKGLAEERCYRMQEDGTLYSGSALMYGGIPVPPSDGEYQSIQMHLTAES